MSESHALDQKRADDPEVTGGGTRQDLSILVADLHGFTALSERLPPEDLVDILNRYLSLMATTISARQGTIDKFLGDGLMALFNAPLPQAEHALYAAQAALDLMAAIGRFHGQLAPELRLQLRVGISTGEAIVGHIGAHRALGYTAIGDAVNLAFRLEEQAEPGQIIISERTWREIAGCAEARPLGLTRLRGRQRVEPVFELLQLHTERDISEDLSCTTTSQNDAPSDRRIEPMGCPPPDSRQPALVPHG